MVQRWLRRWSPEEVRRLVEWNNEPPPVYLRPLGTSLSEAKTRLEAEGVETREPGPGIPCLQLAHGTNPAQVLNVVPGIMQDPGAALVTVYADVPRGTVVGDLCAAPGGKTLALADGGAYVLAADRSLSRLRLLKENAARLKSRVHLVVASAEAPPFRELPFLLLDVPCTGTGTLRRHPDAKWRLTLETLKQLVELQKEILSAGAELVPPGGVMVYSTCTLEAEENVEQVETFLSKTPGYSVKETGAVSEEYLDENGCLSVVPQAAGFDGAFGVRMVRRS
jgi:16S rRNA (cytosine967-C5)-methyltransferase